MFYLLSFDTEQDADRLLFDFCGYPNGTMMTHARIVKKLEDRWIVSMEPDNILNYQKQYDSLLKIEGIKSFTPIGQSYE